MAYLGCLSVNISFSSCQQDRSKVQTLWYKVQTLWYSAQLYGTVLTVDY